MSRNNMTRDDFLKRVSLQWPDEDKEHMADYIINNNSDLRNAFGNNHDSAIKHFVEFGFSEGRNL